MVAEFHRAAGMSPPTSPTVRDAAVRALRIRLVREEADEVVGALSAIDGDDSARLEQLAGLAKELSDLLYVTYGAAVDLGIDLAPIFEVVHRSNMAKFGEWGRRREDGKVLKPEAW